MAENVPSSETGARPRSAGVDEQLWPIACATLVLVGILSVVIVNNSDFDEDRLFLNGYTHLAGLGIAAALLIYIASRLKGAARRTAELAILLSLAWHAAAGIGAFYLFNSSLGGSGLTGEVRDTVSEGDDESLPPDYHWGQDDEQQPQQAFEKVVDTTLREQAPPAALEQPRKMDRPTPMAEIPRGSKVEITPLGVNESPEPSAPLNIPRPDAAKIEDGKPPEALAMVRQEDGNLPLPNIDAPAPAALAEAPKEPPKTLEPAADLAGKVDKIDWTSVAKNAGESNNESLPPHKIARVEVAPNDPLPGRDIIARLPSQAPRQVSGPSGPEAADQISQQGRTLERSDRDGIPQPSAIAPDTGPMGQSPNASDNSPPGRLDAGSIASVEKSDTLGARIASNGNQDSGGGTGLSPSQRGAIDGRGRVLPGIEGDLHEDPANIRPGSPGSNLSKGLPLPSAAARRAIASQSDGAGSGQVGGLPRTQSELEIGFSAGGKIAETSAPSGGGGVSPHPGGLISSLDVDPRLTIRRTAGNGTPRGVSRHARGTGLGEGDLPGNDTIARGNELAALGGGPGGPRRIEGTSHGDDKGEGGLTRARSESFDLRSTAIPAGPAAGTTSGTRGSSSGGTSQGLGSGAAANGSASIGPNARLGGIGRRDSLGQGFGSRSAGQGEPSEIAASIGLPSPQLSGFHGTGGRGDGQLDEVLSGGGSGGGGISRGNGQLAVSGQVHEPMSPFRRGRGGSSVGDLSGGQLTEPAIESGLEYLTRTQFSDGHWSLHELPEGVAADSAPLGSLHADTAATGLALMTYLGAGYTHEDEKYRDVVRRGVQWLVTHQQPDGNLSYQGSDPTHYYSQGIAAMALCEAYGMTRDRELREPAQKAIDFIVKSQDPSRGGWRYRSQEGSDTSVTGWQLVALKSARMAGLEVPEETLRKVGRWLDFAQVPNRGTYVYNPLNSDAENPLGRAPNPTMTAQAMIMRMYLGHDRDNASLAQGADYLLAHLPDVGTLETPQRDCYYWYYATQAMGYMQGDYWKAWEARITPLLRAGQIDRGPLKGSWNPRQPVPDLWSVHGGRHYVTSLHILTLEFRYWHLPLFRELRKTE